MWVKNIFCGALHLVRILYHVTHLPPQIRSAEAILQEIDLLRRHFGGDLVYLNPNIASPVYIP
ncbi:MAG: hypothetical protein D6748_02105, partial [Calditrichaeota bacterium]